MQNEHDTRRAASRTKRLKGVVSVERLSEEAEGNGE
jgi:hypothetical protein